MTSDFSSGFFIFLAYFYYAGDLNAAKIFAVFNLLHFFTNYAFLFLGFCISIFAELGVIVKRIIDILKIKEDS